MKISISTKASNLFNETANGNKKIVSTSNSKNKRMFYYIKGTEPYEDYDLDDLLPTIKEVE